MEWVILLGIDKQANKWPAATCGEYKGAAPPYVPPLQAYPKSRALNLATSDLTHAGA